jgi:CubicO group peptidase (beta-lactamase class C family)
MQKQRTLVREVVERTAAFLESWLPFRYERLEMPGISVLVKVDGDVVFQETYGYANLEEKQSLTSDHIFRIASHSKTFTATALLQLQERELMHMDDPVSWHLPWLREHRDTRMAKVTVRQLMSHSAGMIRDGLECNYWQVCEPFPDVDKLKEEILRASLVFDTNTVMKYSNYGYALLGLVVEEIGEQTFGDFVHDNIIKPLGLTSTGAEVHEEIVQRLVTGYSRRDLGKKRKAIPGHIDTRSMAAATGFYATIEDLACYFDAQFVGSGKLLTDESKKEMQRTQWKIEHNSENVEYGLGFAIDHLGDRRVFGHGGGFPGQITKTMCDPEQKVVVIVLTNCLDGDAKPIAKGIYAALDHFQQSYENCHEKEFGELARFEGRYYSLWNIKQIVQSGDNLLALDPDHWNPFDEENDPEGLEYVNGETLKVAVADGISCLGEEVTFDFAPDASVRSIRYGGASMWPEQTYLEMLEESENEPLTVGSAS